MVGEAQIEQEGGGEGWQGTRGVEDVVVGRRSRLSVCPTTAAQRRVGLALS